jgi:hypothetical protein
VGNENGNPIVTEAVIVGETDQRGLGIQPERRDTKIEVQGGAVVSDVVIDARKEAS